MVLAINLSGRTLSYEIDLLQNRILLYHHEAYLIRPIGFKITLLAYIYRQ